MVLTMSTPKRSICITQPPTIWCDNNSSIHLAFNLVFQGRPKHVEVDYHLIRYLVTPNVLHVNYISTTDQLVYIFTKPLSST